MEEIQIEKEDINSFYQNRLHADNFFISEEYFDNERLNQLLLNSNEISTLHLRIGDKTLSDENKKLLKDKLVNCYLNGKLITSSNIFKFHTLEEVQNSETFKILFFEEQYLDDLKYVKNKLEISNIKDSHDIDKNVELYKKLIDKLEELNIKTTLTIDETIINNTKFKESLIPYQNLKNVTLKIYRDGLYYIQEEYLEEDKKLDSLVSDIKAKDLSPFEKYLAVYNKVKQFKPYKENYGGYVNYLMQNGMNEEEALQYISNPNNKAYREQWENENVLIDTGREQSRYLKYILNNDYMVCVGYSHLLVDLLERVGIESTSLGIKVDTSYSKGFTLEEKPVKLGGHARNLVHINDEKYDIDGYYVSDPTWGNNMELDLYSHALMTIEETTYERYLQEINEYDYLLNVHDMKEFSEKLNSLIDKKYNEQLFKEKQNNQNNQNLSKIEKTINIFANSDTLLNEPSNPYKEDLNQKEMILKRVLKEISTSMVNLFKQIDYNQYLIFYKQFDLIEQKRDERKDTPQDYYDLFTTFGNYILNKTNKLISGDTILKAASVVRSFDEQYEGLSLEQITEQIRQTQIKSQAYHFPQREIYSDNLGLVVENETNKFGGRNK